MKYVLLFCGEQADQDAFEAISHDELSQRFAQVFAWFDANRDRIRGTNQLETRDTATTVRHGPDGPLIIDGPFLEGNELISGYAEIEVADLDEALAMAKTWPGLGAVEIRPVVEP